MGSPQEPGRRRSRCAAYIEALAFAQKHGLRVARRLERHQLDASVLDTAADAARGALVFHARCFATVKSVVHLFLSRVVRAQAAIRGFAARCDFRVRRCVAAWTLEEERCSACAGASILRMEEYAARWVDPATKRKAAEFVQRHRVRECMRRGVHRQVGFRGVMSGVTVAELQAAAVHIAVVEAEARARARAADASPTPGRFAPAEAEAAAEGRWHSSPHAQATSSYWGAEDRRQSERRRHTAPLLGDAAATTPSRRQSLTSIRSHTSQRALLQIRRRRSAPVRTKVPSRDRRSSDDGGKASAVDAAVGVIALCCAAVSHAVLHSILTNLTPAMRSYHESVFGCKDFVLLKNVSHQTRARLVTRERLKRQDGKAPPPLPPPPPPPSPPPPAQQPQHSSADRGAPVASSVEPWPQPAATTRDSASLPLNAVAGPDAEVADVPARPHPSDGEGGYEPLLQRHPRRRRRRKNCVPTLGGRREKARVPHVPLLHAAANRAAGRAWRANSGGGGGGGTPPPSPGAQGSLHLATPPHSPSGQRVRVRPVSACVKSFGQRSDPFGAEAHIRFSSGTRPVEVDDAPSPSAAAAACGGGSGGGGVPACVWPSKGFTRSFYSRVDPAAFTLASSRPATAPRPAQDKGRYLTEAVAVVRGGGGGGSNTLSEAGVLAYRTLSSHPDSQPDGETYHGILTQACNAASSSVHNHCTGNTNDPVARRWRPRTAGFTRCGLSAALPAPMMQRANPNGTQAFP